jgi:6,7-dimethyl-8-ribityllumazine synthase
MSGDGQPTLETDGTGLAITIVSGLWHNRIADGLFAGAKAVLDASGATVTIVQVPGSFELPVAAKVALESGADAVVALGVIVRGETPHFEYVSAAATDGLTRVALDSGKPVGFGVLTVDDEQQGLDRAGLPESKEDVGGRAAEAAIAMVHVLRAVRAGAQR